MSQGTSSDASADRIASTTIESLLEGVQIIGPDLRYLYLNEAALLMARKPREQLLGKTITEVFPGIERTGMLEMLQLCLCERISQRVFHEVSYADGSEGFFELAFEPVPEGVAILSLDVTARHQAQRSERIKTRARAVLSACRRCLVRATDETRLMADVCGVAVEQGGYLLAWIGAKDSGPDRAVRCVAQAGRDKGYLAGLRVTWLDTDRGRGPTGTAVRTGAAALVRFVAVDRDFLPWRDQALARGFQSAIALPLRVDGELWGALSIYSGEPDAFDDDERALLSEMADDVSFGISALRARDAQRKTLEEKGRLERELRQLNTELEQRVALRTRQLEEARDAAESADRAKYAFLSNISHEVRTPMNAILGFSQLMLRNPAMAKSERQHAEAIARAGARLVALIEGVLQLAGIEAGRVSLEEADFDLPDLVGEVGQWLRPQAEAKGVQLRIDTSQIGHRFVATDENKLRLVLAHLIGNAIKFTERGAVSVCVSTVTRYSGGLLLMARVEDSGPGIAPEEIPRLFRRFEQTQSGRARKQGAGVGLAISQEYARLMGGEISVNSQRGTGTVFRLDIPVRETSNPHAVATLPAPAIKGLVAGSSRPKVLIADDEELERGLSAGLLEAIGFDTAQTQLGDRMLTLLRTWRPSLLMIGSRIPGECLASIRRLRSAPGANDLKIVCLSACARPEDRLAAIDAGADDCLQRPVVETALLESIKSLLGVEYEYDDAVDLSPAPDSGVVPAFSAGGANLPSELRARIHHATVAADIETIMSLIDQVEAHDRALASRLRALAATFDYVPILELVGD